MRKRKRSVAALAIHRRRKLAALAITPDVRGNNLRCACFIRHRRTVRQKRQPRVRPLPLIDRQGLNGKHIEYRMIDLPAI